MDSTWSRNAIKACHERHTKKNFLQAMMKEPVVGTVLPSLDRTAAYASMNMHICSIFYPKTANDISQEIDA